MVQTIGNNEIAFAVDGEIIWRIKHGRGSLTVGKPRGAWLASDRSNLAVGRDVPNAMIVGHVHVTGAIGCDTTWSCEFCARTWPINVASDTRSCKRGHIAKRADLPNAVIAPVCDQNVAIGGNRQIGGVIKLRRGSASILKAGMAGASERADCARHVPPRFDKMAVNLAVNTRPCVVQEARPNPELLESIAQAPAHESPWRVFLLLNLIGYGVFLCTTNYYQKFGFKHTYR
jgi:hypothetical protein